MSKAKTAEECYEECIVLYRQTLRRTLERKGIRTNPGMTDEQILDAVAKLLGLPSQIMPDPFKSMSAHMSVSTKPRL